jgi:hypothetical protein
LFYASAGKSRCKCLEKARKKEKMETIKNLESLKKAMELSSRFENMVNNWLYDDLMDEQRCFSMDAAIDGLKYHNHYSSFFYTISDRDKFIRSIENSPYYYSDLPETKKAAAALNRLDAMEYENKNYDRLDEWLDQQAEKLMHIYENDLHAYENPDQLMIDETLENMLDNNMFENYYIDGDQVKQYHPAVAAYYETI